MSKGLYVIKVQDGDAIGIPGVLLQSTGGPGPWQDLTDSEGFSMPDLTDGMYHVVFTKAGYETVVRDWALKDWPEKPILVGMKRAISPMPPLPTREQVAAVQTSLAGLTYHTTQYGDIPAWFYGKLNATDRAGARQTHREANDTHIHIGVSEAYIEPSTLFPLELSYGYDYAYGDGLNTLYDICLETIREGFFVDMPLAGDGFSVNDNPQQGQYNDPQGNTYGFEWLLQNFERIARALQGDGTTFRPDLTPYIIFRPGWDNVFYGWGKQEMPDQQPARVNRFGQLFRHVLPSGRLSIEHTPGNIPCGEGGRDFEPGGIMRNFDTVMSEFGDVHGGNFWQVAKRMVGAQNYVTPADQAAIVAQGSSHPRYAEAHDTYTGQGYLAPGTERGPYIYVGFEPTEGGAYRWVRGQCSVPDVQNVRAYQHAAGVRYVG